MVRDPTTGEDIAKTVPEQTVELEAVRTQLQRILASRTFAETDRLRKLLRFLVEETICGRGSTLKEYLVGGEVFGRPESFDPRSDSIVRVQARNLRKLLAEYYDVEGQKDRVRVSIPKGSYAPVFVYSSAKESRRRPRILWLVAAAFVAAFGLWAGFQWYGSGRAASLAVLPFTNLSGESRYDYLAEAVSEDLTTGLAKIPRLHVAARTSASRFRRSELDVREIGRQLNVAALLEGSLRRTGDNVIVTAQLVSSADGYHLWSESFERPLSALPTIQAEIMTDVAGALNVLPPAPGVAKYLPSHAVNPEARDIFLRGRYKRHQRKVGDLRAGMDDFERAIRIDPQFAEAHAALASAHASIAFHDQASAEDAVRRARAAAERALQLDRNLPAVHMVRAYLAYFRDWDWASSDREFDRALELNPNYGTAYQGYALSLMARGRYPEAIAASRKALELDPLSYTVSNDLGTILWAAGRGDEAVQRSREILSLAPDFKPAHLLLGAINACRGRYQEAISEYEPLRRSGVFGSELLGRLGYAYAGAGRRPEALKILAELEAHGETARVYAHMASVYVGLGDTERALSCLEKSAERREAEAVFIAVEPHYKPLHTEPRFAALRKRIGI
jgi:TolB-like protein/Tfp pilus assembly protein PilF